MNIITLRKKMVSQWMVNLSLFFWSWRVRLRLNFTVNFSFLHTIIHIQTVTLETQMFTSPLKFHPTTPFLYFLFRCNKYVTNRIDNLIAMDFTIVNTQTWLKCWNHNFTCMTPLPLTNSKSSVNDISLSRRYNLMCK